jgi:uncharacterized protein YcfJ
MPRREVELEPGGQLKAVLTRYDKGNRRGGPIAKEYVMERIVLVLCSLLLSVQAHAFEAIATVINVSPVTETVSHPSQRCWTEYQQQAQPHSYNYGGAIFGGIVGGLLGSLIGEGNGKVAAAAVSAGVGAIAGDRLANRYPYDTYASVPVQRCEQVSGTQTQATAYMVTYEYDGQRFMARLPYHPGNQLRVNVSVSPR